MNVKCKLNLVVGWLWSEEMLAEVVLFIGSSS